MAADDATAGSLLSPPRNTSQSLFIDFPSLFTRWAYNTYQDDKADLDVEYYGLREALEDIGASLQAGDWKFWRITHGDIRPHSVPLGQQIYVVDGHQYWVR